jgi:hypothetical protein
MPAYSFDAPPGPGTSPGAVKRWWADLDSYGTPAERAGIARLGVVRPDIPKSQHTLIPEFVSGNYRSFAAAEYEAGRPERERQSLALIETSARMQAAKQRKIERESAAHEAEVTKAAEAWRDKPAGERQDEFRHYAQLRGIIDFRYGFEQNEQVLKSAAELQELFWGKK